MISKSDILCAVDYALISSITNYSESPTGTVSIAATWLPVPIKVGPQTNFNYKTAQSSQGTDHNTEINLSLASDFSFFSNIVLRLTFTSGTILLIGSPTERVYGLKATNPDTQILQINHQSRNKPFKIG